MTTEEIAAERLLEKTREADDFHVDALLAVLAYSVHEDTAPLYDARDKGAQIGRINHSAYALRERAEETLR